MSCKQLKIKTQKMAAAAGVEPATCSLGESRSIQLSYATAYDPLFCAKETGKPAMMVKPDVIHASASGHR